MFERVATLRTPPPVLDTLPTWARPVFPDGLARQSAGVWAPLDFEFTVTEQARVNQSAAGRAGGTADMSLHFEHLLHSALGAGLTPPSEAVVLDLESGDGMRSVVPWLRLLPQARIVASDPASVLLAGLYGQVAALGETERVLCLVAGPLSAPVAPGSVDLVSGVGCLQEQDDPDLVLAAAAVALRPGGHAVFLAPFDGYGILRLAYERICAESRLRPDEPLSEEVDSALQVLTRDIAARTLPDRSDPEFGRLEQKWLFARASLETAARALGFRDVCFLSHNDHETLYRDMALVQLRAATARPAVELPAWALAILDGFDRALRPTVKRLLMLDGTAILTR
jgi:SAM-dependent methyltransferase